MKRLAKRVGWGFVTLVGTSLITFLIANLVPADPARALAGSHADAQTIANIRKQYHLDDALPLQYLRYVNNLAHGDLGRSLASKEPVAEAILLRFPTTLLVSLGGIMVWIALGVPLGIITARLRDTPIDRAVLVLGTIGISLPTFWLGRMLQFDVAYRRGLFPVAGFFSWRHLVLPSITLGIVGVGFYARLVHANMVEVLNQDYVRAARAKGLAEPVVVVKHAFRNAFIPVLTILGMDIASLLGGVIFTENVFALPGVGKLALDAVLNIDLPMIMGTVLFAAVIVVAANIVVDFLYQFVDPRIRAE